jgi:hypothetical protein
MSAFLLPDIRRSGQVGFSDSIPNFLRMNQAHRSGSTPGALSFEEPCEEMSLPFEVATEKGALEKADAQIHAISHEEHRYKQPSAAKQRKLFLALLSPHRNASVDLSATGTSRRFAAMQWFVGYWRQSGLSQPSAQACL